MEPERLRRVEQLYQSALTLEMERGEYYARPIFACRLMVTQGKEGGQVIRTISLCHSRIFIANAVCRNPR